MHTLKTKTACLILCFLVTGCTHLTNRESLQIRQLQDQGVTVRHPIGDFKPPASPVVAAMLNILPGIGNFYLALGKGAAPKQAYCGAFNLVLWPFSILWGVPQAAIDANTINKREMLYYYRYTIEGRNELDHADIRIYR